VIAIFADRMLKHERAVINGDGKQTRDYVFVDDVVRANTLALGHAGAAVFNVGTGIETDVNTIFRKLRAATGTPAPEVHGEAQRGEQLRSVLDSSAIRRTLGWAPAVPLEEGLQRTVDYFRSELT
jgi:UDP-glucose 4-epimerase